VIKTSTFCLQDTQERLQQEEDARNQLFQQKKKLEQENGGLKKDVEDLELALQKVKLGHCWSYPIFVIVDIVSSLFALSG
jgi:hypothetical protein